jgi:hypothetical protein
MNAEILERGRSVSFLEIFVSNFSAQCIKQDIYLPSTLNHFSVVFSYFIFSISPSVHLTCYGRVLLAAVLTGITPLPT